MMKNSSIGRFFDLLKTTIFGIPHLARGTARFLLGLINLVQSFARDNFERIVKATFLFFALLLVQVNFYISLFLATGYMIYEAHLYIKGQISALGDPKVKEEQNRKLKRMKEIPGFYTYKGMHTAEILERLAREVYAWFREDEDNIESNAFTKHLANLGYGDPHAIDDPIDSPVSSGIKTAYAHNRERNELLVLTAGTDFFELGATLIEDLDHAGPGRRAFLQHRDKIVREIVKASQDVDHINLTGHSFGGGISMMLAVELLKEIEAGRLNVKNINLLIYQSAGVNEDVAKEVNTLLARLKESHPDFSLNMVAHFVDFDPVPGSNLQILSDYYKDNANVFLVRRHLTFWSFLMMISQPLGLADAHIGDVYDQKGYVSKLDFKRDLLREDSVVQYYFDEDGYNPENEDRQYIRSVFESTHTKFVCNEKAYAFFKQHEPLFWKMVIVGIAFGACLAGCLLNLAYVLFLPGLLNAYNFYRALFPVLLSGAYFRRAYKEYYQPKPQANVAAHAKVTPPASPSVSPEPEEAMGLLLA